jgi:tRNA-modifying protein YgfZ
MNNTMTTHKTLLKDWTLIHVEGPDAGTFLQNLLTNNVLNMVTNTSKLAGFCSPKGRLLASFWVTLTKENTYDVWITQDIASELIKKLKMFRLRSKVEISDVVDNIKIVGEMSPMAFELTSGQFCDLPSVTYNNNLFHRRLRVVEQDTLEVDSSFWNLLEVLSGIPRITSGTQDLFVPQMINFELVGGVDFKKGCYPGQEIVARSQYLGTIKRRLKIGRLDSPQSNNSISPGTEIFVENDTEQPVGHIVLSSYDKNHQQHFFQLELNNSALGSNIYLPKNILKKDNKILIQDPPYFDHVA